VREASRQVSRGDEQTFEKIADGTKTALSLRRDLEWTSRRTDVRRSASGPGEFASGCSTTRAGHDPVQVGTTMPALRLHHGPIANLFHLHRNRTSTAEHRKLRNAAMSTWREITLSTAA